MNVKEWAAATGIAYVTARRQYGAGTPPVPTYRIGRLIMVGAKAISDCGFATIRTMLGYKTTWNGGRLHIADRWFPSSKTCSGCGAVKAKLPLRVRTYECDACAMVADRDRNAARNLARLVERESGTGVAGDPEPQGSNGCGADRKTPLPGPVAVKRPPGTAPAGQTGTVPPQGGTTKHVLARAH